MLHFIRELFKICQLQRKSNLAMVKQGADIDMRHLAAKRLHSNYRSPGGVARPVRAVRFGACTVFAGLFIARPAGVIPWQAIAVDPKGANAVAKATGLISKLQHQRAMRRPWPGLDSKYRSLIHS